MPLQLKTGFPIFETSSVGGIVVAGKPPVPRLSIVDPDYFGFQVISDFKNGN